MIDKAIEELEGQLNGNMPEDYPDTAIAIGLGIGALKLLKSADISGGPHTFKGKTVEDCIFIRKADLAAGPLAFLLKG